MNAISPSTYEEFLSLTSQGTIVPIVKTVLADMLTPVSAYLRIERNAGKAFLLESVEGGEKIARYSFLGCNPHTVVRSRQTPGSNQYQTIIERGSGSIEKHDKPILELLREMMQKERPVKVPSLPPFSCGAVGYIGYDAVHWFEDLPSNSVDDLQMDTANVMFFSSLLAFDHVKHQIHIIANVFTDGATDGDELREKYIAAGAEVARLEAALTAPVKFPPPVRSNMPLEIRSNMTKERFISSVNKIKEYILAGDAFQVVFSQRFETDMRSEPFQVYRALRAINPSPYMFFLKLGEPGDLDTEKGGGARLFGASPEMLIRCTGKRLEYRPIAGTYKRGETQEEDAENAHLLSSDEKERAEHVMLVDLGRNDLGRVAEYGSVKIADFMFVEKFSHVMHLTSAIEGILKEDSDCFDALAAVFPAGTLSGAPKVRAMEIIDELEPTRRGAYAGTVLYFDYSGNLDSCIVLRSLYSINGKAYIQAGAGIVADSVPESEYQETLNKSRAVIRALESAEHI